ncbi:MAG: CpaF family protein [Chloroflexi bacterium]|nr:CpaF family protein [Chloroflexota bacterium]
MLLKRVSGGGSGGNDSRSPADNPAPPAPPPPPIPSQNPGGPPAGYNPPPPPSMPTQPPSQGQQGGNFGVQPVIAPSAAPTGAPPPIPGAGLPGMVVDRNKLRDFRNQVVNRIQNSIGPNTILTRDDKTIRDLAARFKTIYDTLQINLPPDQQRLLFDEVLAEMVGFGPLEALLSDDTISEVMVNGPHQIYVEQKGKLRESEVQFENDEHVMRVINRIIAPLGRRVDRKWPMVDARLPDGSRVNAIIPPCAIKGPTITIRKFSKKPLVPADLVRFGTVTEDMVKFLEACVRARLNIVVAGGTGSGKTTLLNILSSFIPDDERIITIEDAAELQLTQRHVVSLESKPADIDGTGKVEIRDLVKNSLRMRPERIVIGECRGGETLDMLQAMNTGHDGSLTTAHANTPRDTLSRLETMSMMAGLDLPVRIIREQIASAVQLIVQQARLRDGSRKVIYITEIQGMEEANVVLQDIFLWKEEGQDANGKVIGQLAPTGLRPKFNEKLEMVGYKLPPSLFGGQMPGPQRRR